MRGKDLRRVRGALTHHSPSVCCVMGRVGAQRLNQCHAAQTHALGLVACLQCALHGFGWGRPGHEGQSPRLKLRGTARSSSSSGRWLSSWLQAGRVPGQPGVTLWQEENDKLLLADAPHGILRAQCGRAPVGARCHQGRSLGLWGAFGFQRRQLVDVQCGQCGGLGLALVRAASVSRASCRPWASSAPVSGSLRCAVFHAKQSCESASICSSSGCVCLRKSASWAHDAVFCG